MRQLATIATLSLVVLSSFFLVLFLSWRPAPQQNLPANQIQATKKLLMVAAPTFELGALSGDALFVTEPMNRLMSQADAEYLVVYDSGGSNIAATPQDQEPLPFQAEVLQKIMGQQGPVVLQGDELTDIYVPVLGTIESNSPPDEVRVFFPKEDATLKGDAPPSARLLGILRMGISVDPVEPAFPPSGTQGILLASSVAGTILIVFLSFWWALYKRMQPIHRGVNLLSRGNFTHRIPEQGAPDMRRLAEGINITGARLEQFTTKIDELAVDLSHAEKEGWTMEMVRKMADDLASPAGFLFMNLYKLLEYITGLLKVLNTYNSLTLNSQEAQNLEELKQDTEFDHIIEDVERLVRSCIKAIDKIREISADLKKLSPRELPTQLKRAPINKIVTAALERTRSKFENDLEVETYLEEIPDVTYPFKPLVPVFINILENAMEAVPDSGTIRVKTQKKTDSVLIEITDSGKGISKDQAAKIFEPFFTTKKERLGMGLSICREILQHFNGTITVDSAPGQGTTVRVEMPLHYQPESTPQS